MRPPAARPDILDPVPAWVRRLWDGPWLWLAIIVPLFCVPLFLGLDRTDFENDESIYSFAVDVMLKDGDWLTPKSIPSETAAFLEKPPLKFWITAAPIRLGLLPANEFGMRFMDALAGSLAFLYLFGIGRRIAGPVCGLAAVLLLFTHSHLLFQHGVRTNNMESTVLLAYCAGVYHFLAWRSINPDVKRHVYAMALAFVFGFMTKFVAALFLPVILALAALSTHEDRVRLYRDWGTFLLAALLAVTLIAPWFVYQYLERGPRLFDIMFGAHVVKRFTVYLDPAHLQPWHYYFTVLWDQLRVAGTQLLTAAGALLVLARTLRRRWMEGLLLILWFALPMAAISTGTSKLYHYAYPFLPPVALTGAYAVAFAAKWIDRALIRPFLTFDRGRQRILPRALAGTTMQMALTIAGLVSLIIAAASAAFDRLQVTIGPVTIRNSSVLRPAVAGAIALAAGAPARVLRGVVVAALIALVLPLAAVRANVARAQVTQTPMRDARDCLAPIVAGQVARGAEAPGVWIEARSISFIPFYYLRGLGPWQQRDTSSDNTVATHLLAPNSLTPVILSNERYAEVMTRLISDTPGMIDRVARQSGLDPATIEASLQQAVVGLVELGSEKLVLPGPYMPCGTRRVHLFSR